MKTIILCGGEGTRMKEETEFKPKPLVEIGGKPILWHIMKIYAHYGYNEFILALGYKGNMIKDYFLDWRSHTNDFTLDTEQHTLTYHNNGNDAFKITFVDTGLKSLTGERVRLLKRYIGKGDFMVTYGDGVGNINIPELISFHKQQGTVGTITGVNPLARYGMINLDESRKKIVDFRQNTVGEFRDIPAKHDFIINGGFMVFKNEILDLIEPNTMIEEVFPKLSSQDQLSLYKHEGKWKAMDTYKEVEEMNEYWNNDPFWKVWENKRSSTAVELSALQSDQASTLTVAALADYTRNLVEESTAVQIMPKKLSGKKVLVTGGTGLVGSHLVERLIGEGAEVYCTVRSNNPQSYFFQNKLDQKVVCVDCDVNNTERVFDVVSKYEIEYIFHLAAQPIVATSFVNPAETFTTNIMGTINILEAARKVPHIKGVIVASSDKAYGKNCTDARESDPLAGDHPYDVSKSAADLIATSYWRTYQLPVAVTRFGNIYGPGDLNLNRIVPGIMKSMFRSETLELRSDGKFVRDYVYVKDVVDGYIKVAENIETVRGEAFNFSTGYNFSVLDFIAKISSVVSNECRYIVKNNQVNEIPFQSLNYEKATQVLGWKPLYTLEAGIQETYDWYREFFKNESVVKVAV